MKNKIFKIIAILSNKKFLQCCYFTQKWSWIYSRRAVIIVLFAIEQTLSGNSKTWKTLYKTTILSQFFRFGQKKNFLNVIKIQDILIHYGMWCDNKNIQIFMYALLYLHFFKKNQIFNFDWDSKVVRYH